MVRKLTVASVLLFISGIWFVFEGLVASLLPELYLSMWTTMMNEELLPPNISQIRDFSPKLLGFMRYEIQMFGLVALFGSLFFCVISLIPYRKGEKWAWYAMLVIGVIYWFPGFILTYVGMAAHAPTSIILVILWIVGLALPAKEILHKPS